MRYTHNYGERLEPLDHSRDYDITFMCPKCNTTWERCIYQPYVSEMLETCECGLTVLGFRDCDETEDSRSERYGEDGVQDDDGNFVPEAYEGWVEKNAPKHW